MAPRICPPGTGVEFYGFKIKRGQNTQRNFTWGSGGVDGREREVRGGGEEGEGGVGGREEVAMDTEASSYDL